MKLKIFKPEDSTGIILSCKNPEFAQIMLGCDTPNISNGFLSIDRRRVFFTGKIQDINELVEQYNLKEGDEFPIEGKIVIKESTTPFYEGQFPKTNPKTKEILTLLGAPIYRQTILVGEDSDESDVKLVADSTKFNIGIAEAAKKAEIVFAN